MGRREDNAGGKVEDRKRRGKIFLKGRMTKQERKRKRIRTTRKKAKR